MKNLAIIPARGGSKRIPRKNIKNFCGKPVIAYPIEAALNSKLFSEVMVSTEDSEIAEIAQKFGASVPFMRSEENANDLASTVAVLEEVLDNYSSIKNMHFDNICCIYPVAPLINPADLRKSLDLLASSENETLMPVIKYSHPIQRSLEIKNGHLSYKFEKYSSYRTQELESSYFDAGLFYWSTTTALLQKKSLVTNFTIPYIIDEIYAQDIDNESDWKIAEFKFQFLNKGL